MSVCALILFFGRLRAPRPPPFADALGPRLPFGVPCPMFAELQCASGVAVADAEARERRNQC